MEQTEYEANQKMFDKVKNPENWKYPTIPFKTDSYVEAHAVAEAIIFFVGGAKISTVGIQSNKDFTVESEGYYHYIGA